MLLLYYATASGQFLMDMIDTTKNMGRQMLSMYKRYDNLQITGYIQPQYQIASSKGAGGNIFEGGQFPDSVNNRFRLRRGRIRFDYGRFNKLGQPQFQFVFQFDGTEQGVNIRDFWGRIWENDLQMFAFTTGMFARPFGWEINYSSQDRESPERGRMSQTLMKTERDLGFMVSMENRKTKNFWRYVKLDAGVFNGQGLSGPIEFDSYKDFIGQLLLKSYPVSKSVAVGGGISILEGKILQNSKYRYVFGLKGERGAMLPDSSHPSGSGAPRQYRGANLQIKWKHKLGATILRSEYWQGTQSATAASSETPGTNTIAPLFVRNFNGAFFYLIQDIGSPRNQLILKYDWYDPNTDVEESHIGTSGTGFTAADISFRTKGIGVMHHFNEHVKLTLFQSFVKNDPTQLKGYENDLKDNIFTCRLQFRF
jgi:hypothetical protein